MDRAYSSGAVGTPPAAPASPSIGYPTAGSVGGGIPTTKPGAYWYYMIAEELMSVIGAAGVTPDKANLAQLLAALRSTGVFQTPAQFDSSTKAATTEFVKASGYTYAQMVQFAAGPVALGASHCGKLIDLASAYTGAVTLPAATGLVDGAVIHIWSGSNASVTVQSNGADAIYINNGSTISSLTLKPGDDIVLARFGASAWVAIGGAAHLPYTGVGNALAPRPTATAGVGVFQTLVAGVGAALTLPSGGSWAYFALPFNSSGNSLTAVSPLAGVGAGGATLATAVAGQYWYGFAWRVQ